MMKCRAVSAMASVQRGVPAIYALYAAYDDVAHFAGMQTHDAFEALKETDHYFSRVEKALEYAPRPYHLIVLSDHGQSTGPTFRQRYGYSLEQLIQQLARGEQVRMASGEGEGWGHLNALLTEAARTQGLTGRGARRLLGQLHPDWKLLDDGKRIERTFVFRNYHEVLAFVNATAWISHREDHHPDLLVSYNKCRVEYWTHAIGGLSENDFICAAKCDALLEL